MVLSIIAEMLQSPFLPSSYRHQACDHFTVAIATVGRLIRPCLPR